MGHGGLMEARRIRGSSSGACPRVCGARAYFYFNRTRVLARLHATAQLLGTSSVKGYLPKATKHNYAFFCKLIGKEFARAILNADEIKIRVQRQNGRRFNFYSGETRQGKRVALLEVY